MSTWVRSRCPLQRYVDKLAGDGHSASTIALSVAPLRAIYARAIRLGEVRVNPTNGLALPAPRASERRIATPEQIERILAVVEPRDRAPWSHDEAAGLLDAVLARQAGGGNVEPTAPQPAPHPAQTRS